MSKTLKAIVLLIILGLLVWGIKSVGNNGQTGLEPIKIGIVTFPTGPLAAFGQITVNAVNLAVKDINASGGVNGRKVEAVFEDYGYDPKRAIPAYEALKSQGIKFFMLDGSAAISSVRPLIVRDNNLSIVSSATIPSYTDGSPLTCRLALTSQKYGPAIADYIAGRFPKARVAFLIANNDFSKSIEDTVSDNIKDVGGTVAGSESFDQAASDFRTQVTKLKSLENETDILVVSNAANTVESMFKQLRDLKYGKPIVSENWTALNPQLKNAALIEGVVFADYSFVSKPDSADRSKTAEFKQKYFQAYNQYPSPHAANGYDAVNVLIAGITKASEQTPIAVSKAIIEDIREYSGVSGDLRFNSDCEVDRPVSMRVIKAGVPELLK